MSAPSEHTHEPQKCMIIQREVGSDTESFAGAMTAAMRQDPDVVMVGEIRNREIARACLEAVEAGRLVLSALPTPDALATLQRVLSWFPADERDAIRDPLGDGLEAIVSLRLVASTDGRRRIPAVEVLRKSPAMR